MRRLLSVVSCATLLAVTPRLSAAQARPAAIAAARGTDGQLRALDAHIDQLLRSRDLRVREVVRDSLLPDRRHERLDQYHRGVRIVGGDLTRQIAADGTVSVLGMLHTGIDLDTAPRLPADAARSAIANAVGGESFGGDVELVILPLSDGYHLAYYGRALANFEIVNVFVDANSAALLRQYSDFISEGVIGKGKGTYGDDKKISVTPMSGAFFANDGLRPGAITTYDMRGNFTRTQQILNVQSPATTSDVAASAINDWSDGAVVDAHVYGGWYYDYLFKRFGRNGINDRNLRIALLTHPVPLSDIASASSDVLFRYYVNAFFCPSCGPNGLGAVTFGDGAPFGYFGNFEVKPFSAALDIVAHELTHAVTAATARLNVFAFSEADSLNEGFSDIFGAATAFFYFPSGTGPLNANYRGGNALTAPPGFFVRSLSDPQSSGHADHYTGRITGGDPHFNGTIAGHAFYLAIEGGVNRTSGRSVQGVGASNRDQIEKAFFRALTLLIPSSSTFALTRVATIQAARDLYGSGSNAERAITQAWDAVGVQERVAPTAALNPDPAIGQASSCGITPTPNWSIGLTASAGSSNLRITTWTLSLFDAAGATVSSDVNSAPSFASTFGRCGPGSSSIMAQADACAAICVGLVGRASGAAEFSYDAVDDAGRTLTASSGRVTLAAPR